MPMDGLMLGYLARELKTALLGGRVDKITQPEQDEIVLLIRAQWKNCPLLVTASPNSARAQITQTKKNNPLEPPVFCMLLRKHLSGARVLDVRQYGGDRILEMDFETMEEMGDLTVKTLVCEFMGRHSNLILVGPGGKIIDSARHVTEEISRVREVLPGLPYERPPQQDKLPYDRAGERDVALRLSAQGALSQALSAAVTGLSPATAREFALRIAGDEGARAEYCDREQVARELVKLLKRENLPDRPTVYYDGEGAAVDVTPFDFHSRSSFRRETFATLSEALDAFYQTRDRVERIRQKSSSLSHVLKNNIERCEKKLARQMEALSDSERMEEYRVKGELLTASIAQIERGARAVELPNYYDPDLTPLRIELDVRLSPGANAQRYFKLYQKARSARKLAAEQKQKTEEELYYLEGQMDNLSKCQEESELAEIRAELEKQGYVNQSHNRRQMKALPPSQPLKFVSSDGDVILVGKNNLQNDKLTATAQAEEWWLHVKNMPGSHVIVASTHPTERTLHEAACLAAYYSKGRTGSGVPVDYTQKKRVKKPAGAKPGFVIYTQQRTLYVTPCDRIPEKQEQ